MYYDYQRIKFLNSSILNSSIVCCVMIDKKQISGSFCTVKPFKLVAVLDYVLWSFQEERCMQVCWDIFSGYTPAEEAVCDLITREPHYPILSYGAGVILAPKSGQGMGFSNLWMSQLLAIYFLCKCGTITFNSQLLAAVGTTSWRRHWSSQYHTLTYFSSTRLFTPKFRPYVGSFWQR